MLKLLTTVVASLAVLSPAAYAGPTLATNGRGDGLTLYRVLDGNSRPLFAGGSGAHARLRPISRPGGFEYVQGAVTRAGGAVALWKELDPRGSENGETFVATRPQHGHFGRPVRLSRGNRVEAATLAVNARGDAVAAWDRLDRSIQYSLRSAGKRFGRVHSLGNSDSVDPHVVVDPDGGALASWLQFDPHGKSSYRSSYRPPGGSFGKPSALDGPGDARATFAAGRGGYALLAWREGDAIKAVERPPGGRFGPPFTVIGGLGRDDSVAAIAVGDGGPAAITYRRGSTLEVVTRDRTAQWSPPQPLGSVPGGSDIDVTMNPRGGAALVWSTGELGVLAVHRDAGMPFGKTRVVAPGRPVALGGSPRPSVSIEDSGRATVAWEEWRGTLVSAYARPLTDDGLGARRLLNRAPPYVREAPPSACRPSNTRLVASSRRSVVVQITHGDGKGIRFGCLLARGALEELDFGYLYPPIELAGPFVAYATTRCESGCDTVVEVMDLRDARNGLDRLVDAYRSASYAEVPAIVLKKNGAVAWVSCGGGGGDGTISSCVRRGKTLKRVFALDRQSRSPREVAAGRRIDPGSLAVHGSRLTWRQGSSRRSARLR